MPPGDPAPLLVRGRSREPLVAAETLETLLAGADRRTRVRDTASAPWRMICGLEIAARSGAVFVGTGWLAGPRTVVTAGHCVFDPVELGGWAASIRVVPGRDGDAEPFASAASTRFSATDAWLAAQDPDYDYGAIHLDADLADAPGVFAVAALPDADLVDRLVNVSGYPASPGNGRLQYFHANRVKALTARRVFYDVDTIGGQSGSPVWAYLDEGSDQPTVIAIHAYGVGGVPADLDVNANSGPRILPEVADAIRGWIARSSG